MAGPRNRKYVITNKREVEQSKSGSNIGKHAWTQTLDKATYQYGAKLESSWHTQAILNSDNNAQH